MVVPVLRPCSRVQVVWRLGSLMTMVLGGVMAFGGVVVAVAAYGRARGWAGEAAVVVACVVV